MSNKAPATTLKPDGKPVLTPKLRFPEFRNGPPWTGKTMGEVYSFKSNNSLSRDQLNYEHGSVKNIHYGDIHTKFSTLFDINKETVPFIKLTESVDGFRPENDCVEGDIIFADASEDMEDIGKSIEVVHLNGERVVAGQHTILARPNKDHLVIGFGAYLFKSRRVRTQIEKESQGAKVLGISATRLTKIKLPIPITKPEQQKIAECLSSVDELIAAQARKLDALKTHKKGLMQELFPREGETQPRLRFPEFQNAGEWKKTALGVAAKFFNGRAYKQEELLESGKYTVLRVGNFFTSKTWYYSDLELDETKYCDNGDLLYAWSASFGPRVWRGEKTIYHYHIWKVVENQGIDRRFLFITLENETEKMKAESANGLGIMHITKGTIEGWETAFPTLPEQQRIAGCLTTLDDLIAAQTKKLDDLKTHKKGLMQQLFPSPEEVEA